MLLVLVPSALLGPVTWTPVADRLRDRGWSVLVPAAAGDVSSPDDVLAHLLGEVPVDVPVVLVPHSNAGLYVAALAEERDVRAVVFVDARVPSEAASTPTTSPEFHAHLAGLADADGRLPVWTGWWPEEEVDGLFPDAATRAAVEADQARLPLEYFEADVPTPAGWAELPVAYVAFGEAYAAELAAAEQRGWPTARIHGEHLHAVVDPDGVAVVLERLLGLLGFDAQA